MQPDASEIEHVGEKGTKLGIVADPVLAEDKLPALAFERRGGDHFTAAISALRPIARQEVGDQRRDLGTRILLEEMPSGDEMRSLGVRQELLEPAGKGRMVEDVVLAPPDDQGGQPGPGEFVLDPPEPLQRAPLRRAGSHRGHVQVRRRDAGSDNTHSYACCARLRNLSRSTTDR